MFKQNNRKPKLTIFHKISCNYSCGKKSINLSQLEQLTKTIKRGRKSVHLLVADKELEDMFKQNNTKSQSIIIFHKLPEIILLKKISKYYHHLTNQTMHDITDKVSSHFYN